MTITSAPGETFTATLVDAPVGLVGEIGFKVIDPTDGSEEIVHRTTDIVEVSPGMYATFDTAPSAGDTYLVMWDHGGLTATEDLVITSGGYASVEDVRTYAPELVSRSDDEIVPEIRKSERDIDWYAGFSGAPNEITGLKFIPMSDLEPRLANALTRAVCAQVQYRFYMGATFLIDEMQYEEVQGKDQTVRRPQRVGPAARSEFPMGLRKLTGRIA